MGQRTGRALLSAAAGLAAASFGLSTACGKTYCSWGVGQDEPVDAGNRDDDNCVTCDAGAKLPDAGADGGLGDGG